MSPLLTSALYLHPTPTSLYVMPSGPPMPLPLFQRPRRAVCGGTQHGMFKRLVLQRQLSSKQGEGTLSGTADYLEYLGAYADWYYAKFNPTRDISDLKKSIERQ